MRVNDHPIRNASGDVIHTSRNLAGIRRYVSNHLITRLDIRPVGECASEGQLSILFDDGSSFQTNFGCYSVLVNFVRNWRNVYGAPLSIAGQDSGKVSYHNPHLSSIFRNTY